MKDGIILSKASCWLILFILVLSTVYVIAPANAQSFSISVNPNTTSAYMNSVVTIAVTVTNIDGLNHVIQLSATGILDPYWPASFNPNPVTPPPVPGATAVSTLTLQIPGPEYLCPGESNPGPYYMRFSIRGVDRGLLGGATVSAPLTVNLVQVGHPLVISIEPSKPSYMIGEEVTLSMDANAPAKYSLKVRMPDGSTWATAQGTLPGTFTKESAEPLGTYTAELTAYYCGVDQASASFVVTPDTYDVTVSLAGLPTDVATTLEVDGNKVGDMKGGDVRVLNYPIESSHTFRVDQYVNGETGYRYYCASNSWTATAEGSYTFNYATQVYLDVSTDPSAITDVTPSGWFALGSPVSISEVPTELDASAGVKYRFVEWTVDGITTAGNGFQITMDEPHEVVAKYDTYFKLTVISDYGYPRGDDYYKSGDTAVFSVDSPVGFGIQQIFAGWTGDYSGQDPSGSITMDGPKTLTATWTISYFQLYMIIAAIVAVAIVAALLLLRWRRAQPATVKPPPPPPPTPEEPEATTAEPPQVTKQCTNCGEVLADGQVHCPECGQKQTD